MFSIGADLKDVTRQKSKVLLQWYEVVHLRSALLM